MMYPKNLFAPSRNTYLLLPKQATELYQCLNYTSHIEETEWKILHLSDKYQSAFDLLCTILIFDKNP